jgi:lactose/L-arabinose transport system ATP-binding protein
VDMRVEIARLHKELGTTMIYVTHDQVEAMTLADKIVVLRAGYIEQVGSPMTLYQDPDNKFVAGFIGSPAMNFVNGVAEKGAVRVPALSDAVIPTSVALPAEGAAVTVGIRPQDMELTAEASPIQLDIRERLGGVAYDYLNTATGERLVVESRGDLAMEEGTEVTVNFDKDRAMFFDAKTEARLR